MARAFAMALLKHIEFSQGAFHIDDLNMVVDEPDALEFSYKLGNSLLKFKKKASTPKEMWDNPGFVYQTSLESAPMESDPQRDPFSGIH